MLLSNVPTYYKTRRETLIQNHPGSAFLLPGFPEIIRNHDVHYPYRQESHFYYLTGFEEPGSFLVLLPEVSSPGSCRSILFVMPRDPEKEMWEGERYGLEGALRVFGVDEAYPIDELEQKLPGLLRGIDRLFYRLGHSERMDQKILHLLEGHRKSQGRSGRGLLPIEDPSNPIGEMRLFKSKEELTLLREACRISSLAHRTAIQKTRPGMNEREVEALIDYIFRKEGCQRVGYGSIVAGGKNAACLHYRSNNEVLRDHELLLVDAGGEYGYYTADITRTFPIGKHFTSAQRKAYELVLRIQKEAIAMTQPGVTLPEIHRHICTGLIDGLLSLGLMKGDPKELLKSGAYRRFYPHSTSHWLGIDVHDAGLYLQDGEPRPLAEGMVFTIEPGFYVQPSDREIPEEYQNIGIRIEDDILVTSGGHENLTLAAPKEIEEIESLKSKE